MSDLWPSMTDYSAAVQNATSAFRVDSLGDATFATMSHLGVPAAASGQNAVVFRANVAGADAAVRCFTTEPTAGRARYVALHRHLAARPVSAMASSQWVDDAVVISGRAWPVVLMEWIDGVPLHEWVDGRRDDSAALVTLADHWRELAAGLRGERIAHGDLQHGNVLVDASGALRLIDFDGVWVPSIAQAPPGEWGHRNYQHPERAERAVWGEHIDWFSALVVYISLRAVAADPQLWSHHTGENLIFTERDFHHHTDLWTQLETSDDPLVRGAAHRLAASCGWPASTAIDLDAMLSVDTAVVRVSGSAAHASAGPAGRGTEAADEREAADDITAGGHLGEGALAAHSAPGVRLRWSWAVLVVWWVLLGASLVGALGDSSTSAWALVVATLILAGAGFAVVVALQSWSRRRSA